MISWIMVGLVVLEESRHYSWLQLLALFASASVCILGVKILTTKTKSAESKQQDDRLGAKSD